MLQRAVGDRVASSLTQRQRQIVRLLVSGGTNRELAARLGVREQTVKNQLSRIYAQLGVRNRLELALYAARHGLGPDADREVQTGA